MDNKNFEIEINSKNPIFHFNLKELWQYKDLLVLSVRRDFVSMTKQTILGPLWLLIQPVLSAMVFAIVFGRIAKISTDGVPPYLFYITGLTAWNFFSACVNTTSSVFISNSGVFGKVYFPRLITPFSIIVSNFIKFLIQLLVFFIIYFYFHYFKSVPFNFNYTLLWLPVLVILLAGYGLSMGLIISALTTKYRDLAFLVGFGVQLIMYATPVIYPLSQVPAEYKEYVLLNPLSSIIEIFRLGFLGVGSYDTHSLLYSSLLMIFLLFIGILLFNKTEKNFMDTV